MNDTISGAEVTVTVVLQVPGFGAKVAAIAVLQVIRNILTTSLQLQQWPDVVLLSQETSVLRRERV